MPTCTQKLSHMYSCLTAFRHKCQSICKFKCKNKCHQININNLAAFFVFWCNAMCLRPLQNTSELPNRWMFFICISFLTFAYYTSVILLCIFSPEKVSCEQFVVWYLAYHQYQCYLQWHRSWNTPSMRGHPIFKDHTCIIWNLISYVSYVNVHYTCNERPPVVKVTFCVVKGLVSRNRECMYFYM